MDWRERLAAPGLTRNKRIRYHLRMSNEVRELRMQQGNLSSAEWFRGIGEYKIDYGPGWRIYLARDGLQIIILLGGGSKVRQQRDIDRAVDLWEQYKRFKATVARKSKTGSSKPRRKE